jgi:hypothetical protein
MIAAAVLAAVAAVAAAGNVAVACGAARKTPVGGVSVVEDMARAHDNIDKRYIEGEVLLHLAMWLTTLFPIV